MNLPVVALAGNPNSGKTTLFNRLTGLRHRVGNYPGITVEKTTGKADFATLVDLPGTYSLVARAPEEAVVFDVLTGRSDHKPALTVLVLDASNLERNLYLAIQIMELGQPVVVALNMIDEAEAQGLSIDCVKLSELLGVSVTAIAASSGRGLSELRTAIIEALKNPALGHPRPHTGPIVALLKPISEHLVEDDRLGKAAWVLATTADGVELGGDLLPAVSEAKRILASTERDIVAEMIAQRYEVATAIAARVVRRTRTQVRSFTDRIDALLLHRVFGPFVFLGVMALIFQSVFAWAEPLMNLIEATFHGASQLAKATLPEGPLRDLFADGILTGVGSVLVFIPQIAILFFAIAFLEDSGYLARAAYIMDRVMAKIGLHGRAFVPLMSGFACAVPAIMAARTIENPKDRLVTIMVLPLVTCSARLPVYALIISALFAGSRWGGLLLLSMYVLSIAFTILAAFVLKRTVLKSPTPALVLELPPYRMPHLPTVLRRVFDRCKVFVRDAGTVILACSIVLWALLSYPKHEEGVAKSYAGQIGHAIEPVIKPLGFDWKIGVGLVGSFAAREVLVATLGLVYGLEDADENNVTLREHLREEHTPLVGLSLMIFFLLACQCMSTLAIVRRETGTWRWPAFMFVYMTVLAWVGSFIVYQGGRLLGFS